MKKYLIIIAVLFSAINQVWAGRPAYSSSSPSGLISALYTTPGTPLIPVLTYDSPLNTIVSGQEIVITFKDDYIRANNSTTGIAITLNQGLATEKKYYSRDAGFYITASGPKGQNLVSPDIIRIGTGSTAEQYKLYISLSEVTITHNVETRIVFSANSIFGKTNTQLGCYTFTLKFLGAAPTIASHTPAHNEINVIPSPQISLTFQSYVALSDNASKYFTIWNETDGVLFWQTNAIIAGSPFSRNGQNGYELVGIPPFTPEKTYHIYYDEGFFTDGASYNVPAMLNGDWIFSVDELNYSSLSPTTGSINVSVTPALTITFPVPVTINGGKVASIYNSITYDWIQDIYSDDATLDGSNTILTLPLVGSLDYSSTFYLNIESGFVEKISTGAQFVGIVPVDEWYFSTTDGNVWEGDVDSDFNNSSNWAGDAFYPSMQSVVYSGSPNNPIISSDISLVDLRIKPQGLLRINSGATLTLSGDLTLESDENNNGSLIVNGNIVVASSNIFVHQYAGDSSPILESKKGYSSPLASISGSALGLTFPIKKYSNANKAYLDVPNAEIWEVGRGYASYINTPNPIVFTGSALNLNASYSSPFTFTAVPILPATGSSAYNFYGNPYTAAIDWPTMWADSLVYSPKAPYRPTCWVLRESGSWAEINGATGLVTNGLSGEPIIPRGHAFMLRAWPGTNTNIYMKKAHLVGNTSSYLKSLNQPITPVMMRIVASNAIDYSSSTEIVYGFYSDAQSGLDRYDAEKYSYPNTTLINTPQIATVASTGEVLAQNIVADFADEITFDIKFYTKTAGSYCLYIKEIDPLLNDPNVTISITDNVDGVTESLKDNGICFYSEITASAINRFTVTVDKSSIPTAIQPSKSKQSLASVSYYNSNLHINLANDELSYVDVYSTNGQLVLHQVVSGSKAEVPFEGNGVYIVKVVGQSSSSAIKIIAN